MFKKDEGYHAVPHTVGSFQPPRTDVSCFGVDNLEFRKKLTGQSNSIPSGSESLRKTVEKPRNDIKCSGSDKVFSRQEVLSKTSQSTAGQPAVSS